MPIFYFDMKDGIPVRDRFGMDFPTTASAIVYSKELAQQLSRQYPRKDPKLSIVVLDESGAEVHRESVYAEVRQPKSNASRA